MTIRRVVPDIQTERVAESRAFYSEILGFETAMDMGWVVTMRSPANPKAQVTLIERDASAPIQPQVSIEVDNVDEVHERVVANGVEVLYPLTNEPWGVRRFFVADPNGVVLNILSHLDR